LLESSLDNASFCFKGFFVVDIARGTHRYIMKLLTPEVREEISNRLSTDIDWEDVRGCGLYGCVFRTTAGPIIKVTTSDSESDAIKDIMDLGLNIDPGFITVLDSDIFCPFSQRAICVYRTEELAPLSDYGGEPAHQFDNMYEEWMRLPKSVANYAHFFSNLEDYPSTSAVGGFSMALLRKGYVNTDLHAGNLGYRLDEYGQPAFDAGLVVFDPALVLAADMIEG